MCVCGKGGGVARLYKHAADDGKRLEAVLCWQTQWATAQRAPQWMASTLTKSRSLHDSSRSGGCRWGWPRHRWARLWVPLRGRPTVSPPSVGEISSALVLILPREKQQQVSCQMCYFGMFEEQLKRWRYRSLEAFDWKMSVVLTSVTWRERGGAGHSSLWQMSKQEWELVLCAAL